MNVVSVWNENCVMAGRAVPMRVLNSEASGNDWHDEDISEDNADYHSELGNAYHLQIARTIRESM